MEEKAGASAWKKSGSPLATDTAIATSLLTALHFLPTVFLS